MSEAELNLKISGDPSGALSALDTVKARTREFASDTVRELEKTAAEWFGLQETIDHTGEAIRHAFEVRDLQQSLVVFTGSVKEAREAMEFFDAAQRNSRNTAMDLAGVYRDLLPQAVSRGFSKESLEPITAWLSQLATISGKTLDDMEEGFQQLLSGRIRATNPLLKVLGITRDQIDGLGWDQIVTKMEEVAKHFPEFGQSWDSTMKKSKEALLDAFAGGFNEANASAATGMAGFLAMVDSPAVQGALHDVGKTIAEIGPNVVHSMSAAAGALEIVFGGVAVTVGEVTAETATLFEGVARYSEKALRSASNMFASVAAEAQQHPALATMLGINPGAADALSTLGTDFAEQADYAGGAATFAGSLKNMAGSLASSGYDSVTAGIDRITHSFDPFTEGARHAADVTSGLTEELKKLLAKLGLVQPTANGAKSALDDFPSDADFEQALRGGSWKSVPKNILEPEEGVANEFAQAVSNGLTKYSDWSLKAGISFADAAALELHDHLVDSLTNDFAALATGGGKGFMRALQSEFPQLAAAGAKRFAEELFGHRGTDSFNPTTGEFESKDRVYGALFGTNVARNTQIALGLGSAGLNAYQSSQAAPGARTGGVLGGAVAGAGMGAEIGTSLGVTAGWGTVIGAVAGAIVGAIGAYVGTQQRQSEYLFADPYIDKNGNINLARAKNLQPAQQQQMIADAQSTIDTYRNDYTRILMTLGAGGASPFKGPQLGSYIQDNPSAHFMEHFQQWMSQTLPREIAGQFKDELKGGFGNLGLSGSQFDSMWSKYQGLDPSKAAAMMAGLADALKSMNESGKYFGQSAGSRMFDANEKMGFSFAQSLDEGDAKILDFASHLKDLVGEDQINAAKQLGDMEAQRADEEKQFIQQVVSTIKAASDAAKALTQSLDVRLIHKADGSADYQGLANYYQKDANSAIAAFTGAKTPQEAQAAWNRFLADLDKVSQAGYGISTQTGDDFTKWAQQQIKNEQPIFDAVVQQMGDDMASRDAAFLAAIQPSVDAFKNSLGGANVVVGNFTGNVDGAGDALLRLQKTVDGLNASLSTAGFMQRTVAARAIQR